MNIFFRLFLLMIFITSLVSCNKDNVASEELRDFATQYATDKGMIEDFLKNNYMTVTNNPGSADDMNVVFSRITDQNTQTSIWDQTDYPLLQWQVDQNNITYTLYYIKLREGNAPTSKSPCNVDNVLAAYHGQYLFNSTESIGTPPVSVVTVKNFTFEENYNPQSFFSLTSVVRGWNELFPKFKTGSYSENPDGTVSYQNFGAGIMFVPSGLGYYNQRRGNIPPYSPLIYSFKLLEIQRIDQDSDGIPSYLEDQDRDGYFRVLDSGVDNVDDTDKDGILDFNDRDDDNDGATTKLEIKNPITGLPYAFEDIPTCSGGSAKKHLDRNCY